MGGETRKGVGQTCPGCVSGNENGKREDADQARSFERKGKKSEGRNLEVKIVKKTVLLAGQGSPGGGKQGLVCEGQSGEANTTLHRKSPKRAPYPLPGQ